MVGDGVEDSLRLSSSRARITIVSVTDLQGQGLYSPGWPLTYISPPASASQSAGISGMHFILAQKESFRAAVGLFSSIRYFVSHKSPMKLT